jgi:hypothetical protein
MNAHTKPPAEPHGAPPAVPAVTSRRSFLGRTVAALAAGAAVNTAAIVARRPAPAADAPDTILRLIADHRAATEATTAAMHRYGEMEELIPDALRQGDFYGGEVTEVATDDPRWTAACHAYNSAFRNEDVIALAMLDAPIANLEGLAALMAYAGEYVLRGLLWPEGIIDDTIDEKPRDWIELVLIKAAATVRQLCPVAS